MQAVDEGDPPSLESRPPLDYWGLPGRMTLEKARSRSLLKAGAVGDVEESWRWRFAGDVITASGLRGWQAPARAGSNRGVAGQQVERKAGTRPVAGPPTAGTKPSA